MYKFENIPSARGKLWRIKETNSNYVSEVVQRYGISDFLARLLSVRNIEVEEIPNFLEPKLKNLLTDPFILIDMKKAVDRVILAIKNHHKIAIYGDYDVDGASATAILTRYLRELKIEPLIYIPDRVSEGYGINSDALRNLRENGADLVISVDCGVTAFEPIAEANKVGLDVIVVDHHLSADSFPEAIAIVNPNRFDDKSGLNNLCAAGVSFMLLVALNKTLREDGFFKAIAEPNLMLYLDLVALGTVCDVMTLTDLNRAFVNQGLKILAKKNNKGMNALAKIAGLNKKPDSYSLGFLIGPRINAAGRLDDCSLGAKILSSDDNQYVEEQAITLNNLNKERQEIEKQILLEATEQAEKQDYKSNPLILVYSKNWHQGVIGIVAGRLKEKFNKPCAVIAVDEEGIGKASARSVSGIDFGSAVVNAKNEGLLINGGGHKAAAGFSVREDRIEELYDYLCDVFEDDYVNYSNKKTSDADLALNVSSINISLLNEMEQLAPFGNGNLEPKVIVEDAKIVKAKIVGEKHYQLFFSDNSISTGSSTIKGICFNSVGSVIGEVIENSVMNKNNKGTSIVGKLKKNVWNGTESVEFHVEDIVLY